MKSRMAVALGLIGLCVVAVAIGTRVLVHTLRGQPITWDWVPALLLSPLAAIPFIVLIGVAIALLASTVRGRLFVARLRRRDPEAATWLIRDLRTESSGSAPSSPFYRALTVGADGLRIWSNDQQPDLALREAEVGLSAENKTDTRIYAKTASDFVSFELMSSNPVWPFKASSSARQSAVRRTRQAVD